MAALSDTKIILNIADTSQDSLLNLYIRKAKLLIKNYLGCADTVDIEATYPDAVVEIVVFAYKNKGAENIKSATQGARSVAYIDGTAFAITDSVKGLLPLPKIVMRG